MKSTKGTEVKTIKITGGKIVIALALLLFASIVVGTASSIALNMLYSWGACHG